MNKLQKNGHFGYTEKTVKINKLASWLPGLLFFWFN